MSKYLGPKKKYLRRFKMIKGKEGFPLKKKTAYGFQFEEKQKFKFIYGIKEQQLKRYVKNAVKTSDPIKTFLQIAETRLDNVIFRLGFALTREHARQLVSHRHVKVDGKWVNIPSYNAQPNQLITLRESIFKSPEVQNAMKNKKAEDLPSWLWREKNIGKIINLPEGKELPNDLNAGKIIELMER